MVFYPMSIPPPQQKALGNEKPGFVFLPGVDLETHV